MVNQAKGSLVVSVLLLVEWQEQLAGLGALGMGIGAFFGGLALGDAALSYANTDMSALKRAMVGLGEAFDETPTKGLIVMGGLMAAGGALGALFGPGKSMKAGFGMFAYRCRHRWFLCGAFVRCGWY